MAKLYTPEQFGLFTLFTVLVTVFVAPSTGRYEYAVMLPEQDEEAYDLVRLSRRFCLVFSLAAGLAAWLVGPALAERFSHPGLVGLLPFLAPFLVGAGYFSILTFWFNRLEAYRLLASSRVVQVLVAALCWVVFGLLGWSAPGLVLGSVLGWVVASLWLEWVLFKRGAPRREPPRLLEVARRYQSFPFYQAPAGMLKIFSDTGVFFVLGAFFSAADVGQFALAFRALWSPLQVIGQVFGQLVNRELGRRPDRRAFYLRQLAIAVLFMGLLVLPVLLVGPWLFRLVFGPEWGPAGELARWLSLWMVACFAVESVSYAFPAGRANWLLLLWRLAYIAGLALVFAPILSQTIQTVTRAYTLYGVVAFALLAVLGWWACGRITSTQAEAPAVVAP